MRVIQFTLPTDNPQVSYSTSPPWKKCKCYGEIFKRYAVWKFRQHISFKGWQRGFGFGWRHKPDASFNKIWRDQRSHVNLRPGCFLLWFHHEALLHTPGGGQDIRIMFQFRIQAPPFLVLKVDVELCEGGQLAMVAFPNLDRACGEGASNKCLAIWSKDDLIHIFAC